VFGEFAKIVPEATAQAVAKINFFIF